MPNERTTERLLNIGSEVVVHKVDLGGGDTVAETQWFKCPIVAKITKFLGHEIVMQVEDTHEIVAQSKYEVCIRHPIPNQLDWRERYYNVLLQDIEAPSVKRGRIEIPIKVKETEIINPFNSGDFCL